jgi:hypothetical protein
MRLRLLAAASLVLTVAEGCSRGTPTPRAITYDYDPIHSVCVYLDCYARGEPVGPERELFETWMERLRVTDADTADWLGAGLREITTTPDRARSVATSLKARLAKLPKKQTPDGPPGAGQAGEP